MIRSITSHQSAQGCPGRRRIDFSQRKCQLITNPQFWIVDHAGQLQPQGLGPIDQPFRETQRLDTHIRILILQSRQHQVRRQSTRPLVPLSIPGQPDQGPQRVGTTDGLTSLPCQSAQWPLGPRILPFVEQSRSRVPVPTVGMIQQRHQFHGRQLSKFRRWPELFSLGNQSVDPSHGHSTCDIHVLQNHIGQERGPFNQFTGHVDHVQCSVRGIGQLDRPEPDRLRSQELGSHIGPARHQRHTSVFQLSPKQKIVGHLANQQVAVVSRWPGVPSVDRHPGDAREESSRLAPLVRTGDQALAPQPCPEFSPRLDGTAPKQSRLLATGNDVDRWRGTGQKLVSGQVTVVVNNQLGGHTVLANKLPSPVVHAHAVLATTAGQFSPARRTVPPARFVETW